MPFKHLCHQSVHRASHRCNLLQNSRTLYFLLQRSLQSLRLSLDASDASQQSFLENGNSRGLHQRDPADRGGGVDALSID